MTDTTTEPGATDDNGPPRWVVPVVMALIAIFLAALVLVPIIATYGD